MTRDAVPSLVTFLVINLCAVFLDLSSRLTPCGVSPSTDPDVRLFRIRLLTGLMTYVFLSTHGVLPLYVFHLSPHLSTVAVSFEEYDPV